MKTKSSFTTQQSRLFFFPLTPFTQATRVLPKDPAGSVRRTPHAAQRTNRRTDPTGLTPGSLGRICLNFSRKRNPTLNLKRRIVELYCGRIQIFLEQREGISFSRCTTYSSSVRRLGPPDHLFRQPHEQGVPPVRVVEVRRVVGTLEYDLLRP